MKRRYRKFDDIYGTNRYGKKVKHGVVLQHEEYGNIIALLNPAGKADKYFKENQTGIRMDNFGNVKQDRNGNAKKLT